MIGLEVVVVELIKEATADVAFQVVEVADVLVLNVDDDTNVATVVVEVVVVGGAVIGTLLWGLRLAELSEVPPLLGLSQGGRRRSVNKHWIRVISVLQKTKEGRCSKNPFDHLIWW